MKMVNGVNVEMTDEEHAFRVSEEKKWNDAAPTRAFSSLRRDRDRLLAECDWVIAKASESGTAVPDTWKTYRQALRDLPAQYDNSSVLGDITWPNKP
jgi:hypothetical protein